MPYPILSVAVQGFLTNKKAMRMIFLNQSDPVPEY